MTLFEEYKQKMSKKGTGFLEFYLWILCPLLLIYHAYNIITMAIGKREFVAVGLVFSIIVAALAFAVTAMGIFLDKTSFWIDISLPIVFIVRHIINIILEIGIITGLVSETSSLWNLGLSFASGILIFADIIILVIFASFLFYFIDHKDIYGY